MFKLAKKWWKYLTAKMTGKFDERADPKVQLEQAIQEAQAQHIRLKDQVTNVVANQKQAELRLNRVLEDLENAIDSCEDAAERLREIGEILALGLVRLYAGKSSVEFQLVGEMSLDCVANQSGHANPRRRRVKA